MTFDLKLVDGIHSLSLTTAPYALGQRWSFPPLAEQTLVNEGTTANRRAGGDLTATRARNTEWVIEFGVDATNNDPATAQAALKRIGNFVARAVPGHPIEAWVRFDTDRPAPLWGQYNGWVRYEIVSGVVEPSRSLSNPGQRTTSSDGHLLRLNIRPYARGLKQQLASATGTVHTFPTSQRPALGVSIATINLFLEPIFGHPTPGTGWDTLPRGSTFVYDKGLFGGRYNSAALSVYEGDLIFQPASITNNTYTASCYVKKPDESAVTSGDVQWNYSGALTGQYVDAGNGWYRVIAQFTGDSIVNPSLSLDITSPMIVDGLQLEQRGFATPLVHGDMIDASWSGTAHNSTSTSTATDITLDPQNVARGIGTIRVVWRTTANHDDYDADMYFFANDNMEAYFDASADTIVFKEDTNTATSSAITFDAGDVVSLLFVYDDSGITIYIDGTANGTAGSTFAENFTTDLDIGHKAESNQLVGWLLAFDTFDKAFTSTQADADHDNIAGVINAGEAVSSLPLFWTQDGDDIVDNCYSKGDSDYPYAVVVGVPGDAPCETELLLTPTNNNSQKFDVVLSLFDAPDYVQYDLFFDDRSGTSLASRCGGAYESTSSTDIDLFSGSEYRWLSFLAGRSNHAACVAKTSGQISTSGSPGETGNGSNWFMLLGGEYALPAYVLANDLGAKLPDATFGNDQGSSYDLDFIVVLPTPVSVIVSSSNTDRLRVVSRDRLALNIDTDTTPDTVQALQEVRGTLPEFRPWRWNTLQAFHRTDINAAGGLLDYDIDDTLTFAEVHITPRYEVLP